MYKAIVIEVEKGIKHTSNIVKSSPIFNNRVDQG